MIVSKFDDRQFTVDLSISPGLRYTYVAQTLTVGRNGYRRKRWPPDTTAEINEDGIIFLRQARLFSDEPVMVEQFSWDEISEGKITVDDIGALVTDGEGPNGFSATLQEARVSFQGREKDIQIQDEETETLRNTSLEIPSTKEIWSDLRDEYGIKYDGESESIAFNDSESDKQNYINFFKYLSESRLLVEIDIPNKTKSAKNYTLNNKPELREGKEMARPVEISEDVWLETQIPKNQKKTNMFRIINEITG